MNALSMWKKTKTQSKKQRNKQAIKETNKLRISWERNE